MLLLCEDLSPHRIAILILIDSVVSQSPKVKLPLLPLIQLLENDKSLLAPESTVQMTPTVNDLLNIIDSDELKNVFSSQLWLIMTPEDLDAQIRSAFNLIVTDQVYTSNGKIQINKVSIMGKYISMIFQAFKVLKFDEMAVLFDAFVQYRAPLPPPSLVIAKLSQNDPLFNTLTAHLIDLGIGSSKPEEVISVPKHDFETLISNQIYLLEKYGTPTPSKLKVVMELMSNPEVGLIGNSNFLNLPQYHYLRFLEALLVRDYHLAQNSLHQYFDYMVANNSKHYYHYALILKALFHEDFGEDEQALDTIEEAILIARENKDNHALTYILLWLYNFMKNKPQLWLRQRFYNATNDQQLLEVLLKKLKNEVPLHTVAYTYEAAQNMSKGNLHDYMELILKGNFVGLYATSSQPFFILTNMATSVWRQVGYLAVAAVYSDLSQRAISCTKDAVTFHCQQYYLNYISGEDESALSDMATLLERFKDHPSFNHIQVRRLLLEMDAYIRRGRYRVARQIYRQLESSPIHDHEMEVEILIMEISLLIAEGNFSKAVVKITNKLNTSVSLSSYHKLKLQILKCLVFSKTENHIKGVTLLLHQITAAKRFGFLGLMVEALLILAKNLTAVGYYRDSYGVLCQVMPLALSLNLHHLQSQGYLELAKVCCKMYQQLACKLGRVLKFLNLAIVGFKKEVALVPLTECFKLEQEVAEIYGDEELLQHANIGLQKLALRVKEEKFCGYEIDCAPYRKRD